jgi:hypothetical protein
MTKLDKLLKTTSVALGFASITSFVFNYFVFSKLQPKMVNFEAISLAEEGLMNWVGVGLLILLVFCSLSLFRFVRYLKKAKKITFPSLLLLAGGILSLLFVFSDVALLGDIGKQYKYGLSQPEWSLLYPIMGFQFIVTIALTYFHFFGFKQKDQVKQVIRDSNIFLVVQYVGIICGLMGLTFSSLGFLFHRAWNLQVHVTITPIILLTPYALAVGYWLFTKLQEKQRQWYDEKQLQDVGKSAFLTLILTVIFMIGLFVTNYNNLGGVVTILWLPLYLFLVLFLFSLGNLYFSGKGS